MIIGPGRFRAASISAESLVQWASGFPEQLGAAASARQFNLSHGGDPLRQTFHSRTRLPTSVTQVAKQASIWPDGFRLLEQRHTYATPCEKRRFQIERSDHNKAEARFGRDFDQIPTFTHPPRFAQLVEATLGTLADLRPTAAITGRICSVSD